MCQISTVPWLKSLGFSVCGHRMRRRGQTGGRRRIGLEIRLEGGVRSRTNGWFRVIPKRRLGLGSRWSNSNRLRCRSRYWESWRIRLHAHNTRRRSSESWGTWRGRDSVIRDWNGGSWSTRNVCKGKDPIGAFVWVSRNMKHSSSNWAWGVTKTRVETGSRHK